MSLDQNEAGTIAALMDRFNTWRLPRLLEIKKRVDGGSPLSDEDITTLERMIKDIRSHHHLAEKHPEYQVLYAKVSGLYKEIVDRAVSNED